MSLFAPDLKLKNVHELTPQFLVSKGIKVLLTDLDNTLATYEEDVPSEKVIAWVKSFSECGISVAVISNNDLERVEKYCKPLGIDYYHKSGKPRSKTIKKAMAKLSGDKKTTALIGDKMITDIFGAKASGIFSIKVPPLGKRRMFE